MEIEHSSGPLSFAEGTCKAQAHPGRCLGRRELLRGERRGLACHFEQSKPQPHVRCLRMFTCRIAVSM